jgi:WD40 repeat protein
MSLITTLRDHLYIVTDMILLKEGRLASCSLDRTIKIWNLEDYTHRTIRLHSDGVMGILETDKGRLVSYSRDNTIKIIDLNNIDNFDVLIYDYDNDYYKPIACISDKIIINKYDGMMWKEQDGKWIRSYYLRNIKYLSIIKNTVICLTYSVITKHILKDNELLYNTDVFRGLYDIKTSIHNILHCENDIIIVSYDNGDVKMKDISNNDNEIIKIAKFPKKIRFCTQLRDGRILFLHGKKNITIIDTEDKILPLELNTTEKGIHSILQLSNGKIICIANDFKIMIYDTI